MYISIKKKIIIFFDSTLLGYNRSNFFFVSCGPAKVILRGILVYRPGKSCASFFSFSFSLVLIFSELLYLFPVQAAVHAHLQETEYGTRSCFAAVGYVYFICIRQVRIGSSSETLCFFLLRVCNAPPILITCYRRSAPPVQKTYYESPSTCIPESPKPYGEEACFFLLLLEI